MPKVLILTDISGLPEVVKTLSSIGELIFGYDLPKPLLEELVGEVDYIFTNPNKSTIFLDENVLRSADRLKIICTASTGLTHIDTGYCDSKGIRVLSLREERSVLLQLPGTAELALALSLIGLRNVVSSFRSVTEGHWDYRNWIGSQMKGQTVGILGMGRLGSMYAHFCDQMGAKVSYFDPSPKSDAGTYRKLSSVKELFQENRVVSLHAHVNSETERVISQEVLEAANPKLILVNTARGELLDEQALVAFLKNNSESQYLADVISNEHDLLNSPIYKFIGQSSQVLITPHIGGMTLEGQSIAYLHAAKKLWDAVRTNSM